MTKKKLAWPPGTLRYAWATSGLRNQVLISFNYAMVLARFAFSS
jgi:hypothetical protein